MFRPVIMFFSFFFNKDALYNIADGEVFCAAMEAHRANDSFLWVKAFVTEFEGLSLCGKHRNKKSFVKQTKKKRKQGKPSQSCDLTLFFNNNKMH